MNLKIPKIEVKVDMVMVDGMSKTEECSLFLNQTLPVPPGKRDD